MQLDNIRSIQTADGSTTFYHADLNEHYHSIHGAHQESQHVYIENGLQYFHQKTSAKQIAILEMGFGTGLNYLLSLDYALNKGLSLAYTGIEAYPLPLSLIQQTNYQQFLIKPELIDLFNSKYEAALLCEQAITVQQKLQIMEKKLVDFSSDKKYDLIYFDAFACSKQPALWTDEMIEHICQFLNDKGIFVTYSVTGNLKRCLRKLGFSIERPNGALGKREMMRATLTQL
jgi:tRNA U34 5-methylaminomethyl-2-thiouridine-forming methyltransferase MnmC